MHLGIQRSKTSNQIGRSTAMSTLTLPSGLLAFIEGKTEKDRHEETDKEKSRSNRDLLCAVCRKKVTEEQAATTVNGSHEHTFFNPHGLVFPLSCWRSAPGCKLHGSASSDFTWFAGYRWTIAVCGDCGTHLGWHFQGSGGTFWALIRPRLISS